MDTDLVQFVKKTNTKPREKISSIYLMVENIADHKEGVVSKKIQFLDLDAVWWITIGTKDRNYIYGDFYPLFCHLETQEYIWMSKFCSYSVSGLANGYKIDSLLNPIDKNISIYRYSLPLSSLGAKSFLELNVKMTMTFQAETSAAQKFFDKTLPFKKIITNNKRMLSDKKYSDFTFIIQGNNFKVHKIILAAASPVFDKVFSANLKETRSNTCQVEDIEPTIFQYLLNFIYAGELPDNLDEGDTSRKLFEAAHYYEIEELKDVCKEDVHFNLSMANAEEIYKWAETYELDDIKLDAWNVIKWDILEIYKPMTPLPYDIVASLIAEKRVHVELRMQYDSRVSKFQKTIEEFN